jgi:hypothetical protein
MSDQAPKQSPPRLTPAERATLAIGVAVTNLIKLGGLVMGINEAMVRSELRPVAMGVAAFAMAGAEGVERFLNRLFGR